MNKKTETSNIFKNAALKPQLDFTNSFKRLELSISNQIKTVRKEFK